MARKRKQRLQEDAGFGSTAIGGPQERARLTPLEVQQKVFRLAFRGYNEQDVDQFLDEVTEDLAALHEENKRLREELELRGSPAGFDDAKRHAEETVRRAREEAARITAEAERRAGPAVGVGGAPPPQFLVRERDFLQQLAALVQGHAETLKGEARRARDRQEVSAEEPPEHEPEEPTGSPEPIRSPGDPAASAATGDEPRERAEGFGEQWSGGFDEPHGSGSPWAGEDPPQPWGEDQERLAEQRSGVPGQPSQPDEEQEPSLRELFWGEE